MNKFWIILKALGIVAALLVIKLGIDYFKLDIVSVSPVITALVAGVIFTIAIMYSGVVADYKESEKIPGELVLAIRNLFKDIRIASLKEPELITGMQAHIKGLLSVMNSNFRQNRWKLSEINPEMDKIDEDIEHLAFDNVAPAFIVKIRNEISTIERLSYRIDTIMETSFLASAYVISVIAASLVIITLLFIKMDPFYEAIFLFGSVAFVIISLLLLIKDMDNPFEYGRNSSADVDLRILFKLEEILDEQPTVINASEQRGEKSPVQV